MQAMLRRYQDWRVPSSMQGRGAVVSHWPVNSEAAVKITTRAFET